jgi:thiamine-phosphate pyrophosphorylase
MPGASIGALLDCIGHFLNARVLSEPPRLGDVRWVQIREKDLSARELLDLVRRAVALQEGTNGLCARKIIVNGRMDVALAAGAAGVHLPAGSIEVDRWRAIAPAGILLGASCHTIDEVRDAEATGADYALFGPVFAPLSKMSDLGPHGIEGLGQAARAVRIPVLALGGITRENTQSCVDAGAAGVAGISMFQSPIPGELPSPPAPDRDR